MHVHLVGVCGSGMGAVGGLLRRAGHRVTGSDSAFHPPMGPALRSWGIETMEGYDPSHLDPRPDLVVIGNVCRATNVEARAAIDGGLAYASMPEVLRKAVLHDRRVLVVAGTHGKTTTATVLASLLDACGQEPGFLIGGIPRDFEASFRAAEPGAPFVIEGDEYDTAFFDKTAKFLKYCPWGAILTSVEHDHVDIYPDAASYRRVFADFLALIPAEGILVAYAGDAAVRELAADARCEVRYYALEGDDTGAQRPDWRAVAGPARRGLQEFDLFRGGKALGRFASPLVGLHNVRNAVAAIALATDGLCAPVPALGRGLIRCRGVRRRQEWLGCLEGVHVYDDFAHHPTAVAETIHAIRLRHPEGRVIAVFEPRSATASRRLHQDDYPAALAAASHVVLAPVGRPEIPEAERLDVAAIAATIRRVGGSAVALGSVDAIVEHVRAYARRDDAVLIMSNGPFGGIQRALVDSLGCASPNEPADCAAT